MGGDGWEEFEGGRMWGELPVKKGGAYNAHTNARGIAPTTDGGRREYHASIKINCGQLDAPSP